MSSSISEIKIRLSPCKYERKEFILGPLKPIRPMSNTSPSHLCEHHERHRLYHFRKSQEYPARGQMHNKHRLRREAERGKKRSAEEQSRRRYMPGRYDEMGRKEKHLVPHVENVVDRRTNAKRCQRSENSSLKQTKSTPRIAATLMSWNAVSNAYVKSMPGCERCCRVMITSSSNAGIIESYPIRLVCRPPVHVLFLISY
jgi:hypothetical protein